MAAFLSSGIKSKAKSILILLGPRGTGKTTYGQKQRMQNREKVMFLSTGLELRSQNMLSTWQEPDMAAIKHFCHKLMAETFEKFKSSETHEMLILDCVKDLHDAEYVAAQAKKHDLEITRAVLFPHVGLDWDIREENRDTAYLKKWHIRTNDVLNYYKKMKLLNCSECTMKMLMIYTRLSSCFPSPSLMDISKWRCIRNKHRKHVPSLSSLDLVINSAKIKTIHDELLTILKVNELHLTSPSSFVHCYRDVTWVINQTRYHVSTKTNGVRCLLMKIQSGTYIVSRKIEIYPCCITDDKLPVNTVLDGELLSSTPISEINANVSPFLQTSVFLAFDALAVSGDVLWRWPFTVRQESLRELRISKDVAGVMMQASKEEESSANEKLKSVDDEENSLNQFVVNCVVKEHKPSTPDEVLKVLRTLPELPYSCNGLVFTPNTAYIFGPNHLLFQWQGEDSIYCDILYGDVKSEQQICASHSSTAHRLIEKMRKQPYTEKQLFADIAQIENIDEITDMMNLGFVCPTITTASSDVNHPSLGYSFDELYSKITEQVKFGNVEKTVDSSTKLEIFNYSTNVRNPLVSLCRGLVLHPDSKTIVTKPFIRFFEGECDPNEDVEATLKYDGSLGIAFLWNGEIRVTTKRRMDSEQAIWAKQWVNDHCNLEKFQAGYTYLFEIIYQNNIVIVNYLFEGLVLLAITDENGQELSYDDALRCARKIGFFMVTPRITAPYSEVMWYCGGINLATKKASSKKLVSGVSPVCQQEGWVVKLNDGRRQKIVYWWWKKFSKVAHLVHPQTVWVLVKHNKLMEILGNVPGHIGMEVNCMVRALGRKFVQTIKHVEEHLTMETETTDESGDSKDETSEEDSCESYEKPVKLCLGEDDKLRSGATSSQDQPGDSKDETKEEDSFKSYEKPGKLCLDEVDNLRGGATSSQDQPGHSKDETSEEDSFKSCEKPDKLCLDEDDNLRGGTTSSQDQPRHSKDETSEEDSFKSCEKPDKLCLDEDDNLRGGTTSSQDHPRHSKDETSEEDSFKSCGKPGKLCLDENDNLRGGTTSSQDHPGHSKDKTSEEDSFKSFVKPVNLCLDEDDNLRGGTTSNQDQPGHSKDKTSEEDSFKSCEKPDKLCLDEDDTCNLKCNSTSSQDHPRHSTNGCLDKVMTRDETARNDDEECFEESDVILNSEMKDFAELAHKIKPYFQSDYKAGARSVNLSPIYNRTKINNLRIPVLDYICPTSPVLDGYEPSENFRQTWCKGWKILPINQIRYFQEILQEDHLNPPFLQLPVEIVFFVLELLDGKNLAIMAKVCMQLRQIVHSSETLRVKINLALIKRIQARKRLKFARNQQLVNWRWWNNSYY